MWVSGWAPQKWQTIIEAIEYRIIHRRRWWCLCKIILGKRIAVLSIIDQSHRYGCPQAACREPAGSYDKTTRTAICFEHKTQYLLIRAPYIPALWYFGTSVTYPPWFCIVKLVVIPPRFVQQQYLWNIAIQPAVGCYNPWANLRGSGCYPLCEKLLRNRSIDPVVYGHE